MAPPTPPALEGTTVLQVIPALDAGGAERTTVDVSAALVDAGARALVASAGGRLVPELEAAGAEWIEFPAATKNPAGILANAGRLRRLIAERGIDLVHARSRAPAWSALMASRRAGVAFITTYHGAYRRGGPFKNLYNSVMARGATVIANSRFTAAMIAERHPFARQRIEVIYRGTDLSAFDVSTVGEERVAALRSAWGIAPGRRVVLLPGRLTPWKGQSVLIDAARLLREAGDETIDFVLAGDAQGRESYVRDLVDAMVERGVQDRVRIVGHCTDMPAAVKLADAVVVASTQPEAFGRVAAEAQAAGCPVVVSDLGAVPETVLAPPDVEEGLRTGWRVRPGDPQALARAIAEALAMPEGHRAVLAERARLHVAANFSLEAMTSATLAVYKRHLGARNN